MSEFVELIQEHLAEDRKDIADDGDELPSEAAVQMCIRLAGCIADVVESHPNVKRAAFVNVDGGIHLVLSSGDRRVTYSIAQRGALFSVSQIDEKMASEISDATIDDTDLLCQKAEWVAGDAT